MPAYVISEVEVLDEAQGQRYREPAAASISRHGGRYVVRGAQPDVPEGDWPASRRVVVVEFPSMVELRRWYGSADYAEALAVSRTALTRRLLFVDGLPDVRAAGFAAEAHRQSALTAASPHEADDQTFVDALSSLTDEEGE